MEVELFRDGDTRGKAAINKGEIIFWVIASFLGISNWRRTKIFISKIKIYRLFLPTMHKVFKYFAAWEMQLAEGRRETAKCQLS